MKYVFRENTECPPWVYGMLTVKYAFRESTECSPWVYGMLTVKYAFRESTECSPWVYGMLTVKYAFRESTECSPWVYGMLTVKYAFRESTECSSAASAYITDDRCQSPARCTDVCKLLQRTLLLLALCASLAVFFFSLDLLADSLRRTRSSSAVSRVLSVLVRVRQYRVSRRRTCGHFAT